jgi:hypothetical protein
LITVAGIMSLGPELAALTHASDQAAAEEEARLAAAVDQATQAEQAAVRELADLERTWTQRRVAAVANLQALDQTSGDEVLDAALAGEKSPHAAMAKRKADAKADIEIIDSTITAARRRRVSAIQALSQARAAAIREHARPLLAEADELEEKATTLQAALEAFVGVEYEIKRPEMVRPGEYAGTQVYRIPRWDSLRRQAAALENRAAQLEATPVRDRGGATAESIEALVDQVVGDGSQLGPVAGEVIAWAQRVEARERARRATVAGLGPNAAGYTPPGAPIVFHLAWRDGVINEAESLVVVSTMSEDDVATLQLQELRSTERTRIDEGAIAWLRRRGGNINRAVKAAQASSEREWAAAVRMQRLLEDQGLVDDKGQLVDLEAKALADAAVEAQAV